MKSKFSIFLCSFILTGIFPARILSAEPPEPGLLYGSPLDPSADRTPESPSNEEETWVREMLAQLPLIPREVRGSWLVTVHNIDWPSNSLASPEQQQQELKELLERAHHMGLNAVFFQVRPASDAFYQSELEPWSSYLTGKQGRAPDPLWDPLEFAVQEAHQLGLELHAWINPYRVGYLNQQSFAKNHIFRQRPDLVRLYGETYWLDPGNPETEEYVIKIIKDIALRYDIDGIHLDDYFYPYPEKGETFRDQLTHKVFGNDRKRPHWRRENVNQFIERLYNELKSLKPLLSFGVSPFAIWQNENPKGVRGLEGYTSLYADSKQWFQKGWVDYLAPQFYWPSASPQQPYEKMLSWWIDQNTMNRSLLSGVNVVDLRSDSGIMVDFSDVKKKIILRRNYRGQGEIYYSLGKIKQKEWIENLRSLYPNQALPPLLSQRAAALEPPQIELVLDLSRQKPIWQLSWEEVPSNREQVKYWILYFRKQKIWNYKIYPERTSGIKLSMNKGIDPRHFAVAAVDYNNSIGPVSWFSSIDLRELQQNIPDLPKIPTESRF